MCIRTNLSQFHFSCFSFSLQFIGLKLAMENGSKSGKNGKLEVWKSVFRRLNSLLNVLAREVIIWFAQCSRAHTFTLLSIPCHKSPWKIQQNFQFGTQGKNETTMWEEIELHAASASVMSVWTWNKKKTRLILPSIHRSISIKISKQPDKSR